MLLVMTISAEREQYSRGDAQLGQRTPSAVGEAIRVDQGEGDVLLRREKIENIADVTSQLTFLDAYKAEKKRVKAGEVADLKALGRSCLPGEEVRPFGVFVRSHQVF